MKVGRVTFLAVAVLVIASLIFAGCATPAPQEEASAELTPMKLRFGSPFPAPETSLSSYAAKLWMDRITERTGGKITFDASYGCALGKPAEYIDMIKTGALDFTIIYEWYTPSNFPIGNFAYAIPFGPDNGEISYKAKKQMHEEFPQFSEDMAKMNAQYIFLTPTCEYTFLSKEPLNCCDDFNGKKVMLIGRYFGKWVEPLGAVPVVTAGHERYTMAQTGVATVDLLPPDLQDMFKVQEQLPYYLEVGCLYATWISAVMNMDTFNKLPLETQKLFVDTGDEVGLMMATEVAPKWKVDILSKWREEGVQINALSEEERAKWASLIPDIAAEWAAEVTELGYPGWEIVRRYQEITSEMGYEWARTWGVQ